MNSKLLGLLCLVILFQSAYMSERFLGESSETYTEEVEPTDEITEEDYTESIPLPNEENGNGEVYDDGGGQQCQNVQFCENVMIPGVGERRVCRNQIQCT